jgi:hypothetical protein
LADTARPFRDLDEWLRRRLRQVRWKQWKVPTARRRNFIALGMPAATARHWAGSSIGPGRMAGSPPLQRALPNANWTGLGLRGSPIPTVASGAQCEPPDADPARPVGWEGPG